MKKIVTAAALAASLCLSAPAAQALDSVYLNDYNTYALRTVNGVPMLVVRTFFEGAGYTVQWNGEDGGAVVFDSDLRLGIYDGNRYIFVNDSVSPISSEIIMDNGTLLMPLDAAATALDAKVIYWNNSAYITSDEINDCSTWQYEVLFLTNLERAKAGLPSLVWNQALAEVAEAHCADMSERGYFSHGTPEGITPFDRAKAAGIAFTAVAENIAAGQPDPESVMQGWMNSPGHRKNILDPELTELGVAFVRGGRYGIYWAQEFISK